MALPVWRRLIRFHTSTGEIKVGEPVVPGQFKSARVYEGDIFGTGRFTGQVETVSKLLAPIAPVQILCIGLNYKKHAQETGKELPKFPIVFAKNLMALQHPNDPVTIPAVAVDPPEVDYEAELAFVINRPCKNVDEAHALDYVGGYLCANDISARRWQGGRGGGQWLVGKSFDSFCPLGPQLVSPAEVGDPQSLTISLSLNGKTMQSSSTADMIFGVRKLVSFLSQGTTLLPGTVILTGTPEGVGFARKPPVYIQPGDIMTVSIEKLGDLVNPVVADSRPPIRQDEQPAKL